MAYTTINKSTDYFNTVTFTGNGSLPRAITGVGHQPDFVWLKDRDTAYNHQLYDIVRGTSAGVLYSNTSSAEDSTYQMSSFDSDGYTMGSQMGAVNENNKKIVSWNWKAGGGQGSSNTDGSLNTTYTSANTTAGFSISTYTGTGSNATIGHGLGVAPKIVIVKNRTVTKSWGMYNKNIGAGNYLALDTTATTASTSTLWNSTDPTNTVFSIGTSGWTNASGQNYVAYCFAEKAGYSKFGSYVGNGNADGSFIYTGFKPAWLLVKQTTGSSQNWYLWDNKRDSFNLADTPLKPDENLAESGIGSYKIDMLSNGFKFRGTESQINASGQTYIYMAFGQSLVGSNNVPCTAR